MSEPMVTVELVGEYASGHKANRKVEVRPPTAGELLDVDLADWWNEVVFPETGDGRPHDPSCWEAKVVTAPACSWLVGRTYEWVG